MLRLFWVLEKRMGGVQREGVECRQSEIFLPYENRVLLAGEMPENLRAIISNIKEIEPSYCLPITTAIYAQCQSLRPHLLIMTQDLAEAVLARLAHEEFRPKVLVIVKDCDELCRDYILNAGADGCILHNEPPEQWRLAIETVLQGGTWLSRPIFDALCQLAEGGGEYCEGCCSKQLNKTGMGSSSIGY